MVIADGDDHLAVWAEGGEHDIGGAVPKTAQFLASGGVPQADEVVIADGDEDLAVGAERGELDRGRVARSWCNSWPVAASHRRTV